MDIHLYIHNAPDAELVAEVRALSALINQLVGKEDIMTKEFDALQAEVDKSVTVQASVVSLVQGLATQIEALKNDPVKLQALADQLSAADSATAAAVLANTPAAPTEPPVVVE